MNIKPTRKDAIRELSRALHPNVGMTIFGDGTDFTKIVLDDSVEKKFSSSDIDSKHTEMISDWESKDYARKRASEYPSILDQLDEIYHNGVGSWKAIIKKTKDKYPKG
tara:strand:- start:285 stop:608 length:324 start_codon:yes stop_codon:yes gene_type:complete